MATTQLLARAAKAADGLDRLGSDEAPHARLLAGRVALALHRPREADRRRAAAPPRAHGWLAEALSAWRARVRV